MELRQLNTFIEVARLSSFTRAAEALGYTQPTVTSQIQLLEAELGVRLFERSLTGAVLLLSFILRSYTIRTSGFRLLWAALLKFRRKSFYKKRENIRWK